MLKIRAWSGHANYGTFQLNWHVCFGDHFPAVASQFDVESELGMVFANISRLAVGLNMPTTVMLSLMWGATLETITSVGRPSLE